jgi:hypothetical protein
MSYHQDHLKNIVHISKRARWSVWGWYSNDVENIAQEIQHLRRFSQIGLDGQQALKAPGDWQLQVDQADYGMLQDI